ncbi:RBP11-like subunits of RNA polymerase [Daedaleopsis nitida]|nr:RBP11-like subunits of RNA polymerase [Daedaleopsis nitida]
MAEAPPKIRILKGAEPDLSAATYQIHDESHTIGNALRWMLMKNPKVEFCGYSVPHPSEPHINMRIQMFGTLTQHFYSTLTVSSSDADGLSSLTALLDALKNLDDLCVTIDEAYTQSLQSDQYERWDEKS